MIPLLGQPWRYEQFGKRSISLNMLDYIARDEHAARMALRVKTDE